MAKSRMKILSYWYQQRLHPLLLPLVPFSLAFRGLTSLRRRLYRWGVPKTQRMAVPVIIVGNLTVGGTGKTPFVDWLVNLLKEQGKNPGIALRGVGGKKQRQPVRVTASSDPREVGDEAVLLAHNTYCPIVACIDRVAAVQQLLKMGCNLIICDDGLQHYRLGRDLEIVIIDGDRYFGNGFLLPAGPLREPVSRLNNVDFRVVNQQQTLPDSHNRVRKLPTYPMKLQMESFVSVHDKKQQAPLSAFAAKKVHAVAGIGNPQRFFDMLRSLDIEVIPHVFPDHHLYRREDLLFADQLDVVMTQKDAIKCRTLGIKDRLWYLRVKTEVHLGLQKALLASINHLLENRSET